MPVCELQVHERETEPPDRKCVACLFLCVSVCRLGVKAHSGVYSLGGLHMAR